MFYKPLLIPLLVQVFLTFLVWFYLFARRIPEIVNKQIDPSALKDRAESHRLLPDSAAASNNLKNLFELPVLFYLGVVVALLLLVTDPILVALAWGFVGSRVVHSAIHCSYNNVNHRFAVYVAGSLFLLLFWVRLAAFILVN